MDGTSVYFIRVSFLEKNEEKELDSVMIPTLAYSSSFFGISCAMKVGDSVVIIQSKEKRTRSGCLYVINLPLLYYNFILLHSSL